MAYKFGQELTLEEVALAETTSRRTGPEPTTIEPVPSPEEMATWMPDPDPTRRRFRKVVNVQTGEVKHFELTLQEYRDRHVRKIIGRNEYVAQKARDAKHTKRQQFIDALLDKIEADPTILDRIK